MKMIYFTDILTMTKYESYRVALHFLQVCATVSIPIVAVLLQEMLKRKRKRK